jgi:hypothetical protein
MCLHVQGDKTVIEVSNGEEMRKGPKERSGCMYFVCVTRLHSSPGKKEQHYLTETRRDHNSHPSGDGARKATVVLEFHI